MSAIKGLLKYIGIVLVSIILIFAFVVGLMFFIKDFSVFGYYFRQKDDFNNKLLEIDKVYAKGSTISLGIVAKNFDVKVVPSESETINITYNNSYFGFVKGTEVDGKLECITDLKIEETKTELNDHNNGVYHYTITEPTGLLSMRANCQIIVAVPYKIGETVVQYNLDIDTHNGDILLDSLKGEDGAFLKPLNVKQLDLTTNKGDANFEGLGNGADKLADDVVFEKLNISTNGGTFDFRKFNVVQVNDKIKLDSKKANYFFNTLKSYYNNNANSADGGIQVSGTNVEFRAHVVMAGKDGFSYKSETGVLAVDNLITGVINGGIYDGVKYEGKNAKNEEKYSVIKDANGKVVKELYINGITPYENTIFTDSAVIELGVVAGKLGIYNEYGEVNIAHLVNQASIRTENGNINITKSGLYLDTTTNGTKKKNGLSELSLTYSDTSSLILYSEFGNITVGEYYQDAIIYSKKGKITANSKYIDNMAKNTYNEDGSIKGTRYFFTEISTKDGKVTFTTDKNPVKIIASDNATIDLKVLSFLTNEYNPFNDEDNATVDYMYVAETKNGTVKAQLPLDSFKVRVECKKVEGSIGATENFKNGNGEYYDVQISATETTQPSVKITGKKAQLSSDV